MDLDGLRASLALMFLILSVLCFSASNFALVFLTVAVLDGVFRCWTKGALHRQLPPIKVKTSNAPGRRAKDSFKMSIQPPISLFCNLEF
jgi:hypothetical protein